MEEIKILHWSEMCLDGDFFGRRLVFNGASIKKVLDGKFPGWSVSDGLLCPGKAGYNSFALRKDGHVKVVSFRDDSDDYSQYCEEDIK